MSGTALARFLPDPLSLLLYTFHLILPIGASLVLFGKWGQLAIPILPLLTWLMFDRGGLKSRIPRWVRAAYTVLATGIWLVLGWGYEYLFDPGYFLFHCLAVAASTIYFARFLARRPLLPTIAFWILVFAEISWVRHGAILVLFTLFTGYAIWQWSALRAHAAALTRAEYIPAVSALLFAGFIGQLRFAPRPDFRERALDQPGVTLVLPRVAAQWPKGFSHQIRFVQPGCSGDLFIGSTGEMTRTHDSLARINPATGEFTRISGVRRSSNNAWLDCPRRLLVVGSEDTSELVAYDPYDPVRPLWSVPLPEAKPRILHPPLMDRFLIAQDDGDFRAHVVDLQGPALAGSLDTAGAQCAFPASEDEMWFAVSFNESEGPSYAKAKFAGGGLEPSRRVSVTPRRKLFDRLRVASFCAFDRPTESLWVAQFHRGVVENVNPKDGSVIRSVSLRRGLRFLAVDEPSRLLAVSNYLTGDLTFADTDTGDVLGTVWVAPRVRWINFAADARKAYVASSAGVFEIDLEKTGIRPTAED